MVASKRRTRVIWSEDQRKALAKEMASYVTQHKYRFDFPFKQVFIAAQTRLGFSDRGIFREYYSQPESHEFRAMINNMIADALRPPAVTKATVVVPPPPILTPETALQTAVEVPSVVQPIQEPTHSAIVEEFVAEPQEDDPMAILTGFMESATKLTKLLMSERQARQLLEIKLVAQQQMIDANNHATAELRKAFTDLEDFLTKPGQTQVHTPIANPLIIADSSGMRSRKQRVHLVGMEDRNHAHFQNSFGDKIDFKFYSGDSRPGSDVKIKDTDRVVVAVDFCSHVVYNSFADSLKRQGLKSNLIPINGGMTAVCDQLKKLAS